MVDTNPIAQLIDECREAFVNGPMRDVYPIEPLGPPAKPGHIAAAEAALGVAFPEDLVDLLLAADGGTILPAVGSFASVTPEAGAQDSFLVRESRMWRANLQEEGFIHPIEHDPRSDFVFLAGGGQFGFLLQTSGADAGAVLHYQVVATGIIKSAPSITNLLLAYRDMVAIDEPWTGSPAFSSIYDRYGIDPRTMR